MHIRVTHHCHRLHTRNKSRSKGSQICVHYTSVHASAPQPYTRDLGSRDNALNLLRLALAFLVVFSHAQILAGVGDGVVWQGQHLGSWAVVGFFGISGFLITGARTRSNGAQYLMNRITRIYPGFLLSLVAVAFIFAPIAYYVEKHSFDGFFGTPTTPLQYIYSMSRARLHQCPIRRLGMVPSGVCTTSSGVTSSSVSSCHGRSQRTTCGQRSYYSSCRLQFTRESVGFFHTLAIVAIFSYSSLCSPTSLGARLSSSYAIGCQ